MFDQVRARVRVRTLIKIWDQCNVCMLLIFECVYGFEVCSEVYDVCTDVLIFVVCWDSQLGQVAELRVKLHCRLYCVTIQCSSIP